MQMNAKKHTYDMDRVLLWEQIPLSTPFQLSIEPTFVCNFKCNYCIHSKKREVLEQEGFRFGYMEWDIFKRIIEQCKGFPNKIKKITLAGLGEPLLHKQLPQMIRLIKEADICEKVLVISNGALLTNSLSERLVESGLDELKISLQGLNDDKYKETCGVSISYNGILENIKYFSKYRNNCLLKVKIADTVLSGDDKYKFEEVYGDLCDFIDVEHIIPQFHGVNYTDTVDESSKNRFGFVYKPLKICSILFYRMNVLNDGRITFGQCDGVTFDGFKVTNRTLLEMWTGLERRKMLLNILTHKHHECIGCDRWSLSATPLDIVDGHENEVVNAFNDAMLVETKSLNPIFMCAKK